MHNINLLNRILNILIIYVLCCFSNVYSQLSIGTEIRPRAEFRNGYGQLPHLNDKPAIFINQRSRLNIQHNDSLLNYCLSIQDVRVWGDANIYKSTGVFGSEGSLDLYQAYVEWQFQKNHFLKIGRQEFKYDDQRLLSLRNWNQHGIAYDALLLKSKMNQLDTHLALSLNNNQENRYGNHFERIKLKTLNFLYVRHPISELGYCSLTTIVSGNTSSDTSEVIFLKATVGGYVLFHIQKFNFSASTYYQFGKDRYGLPVTAYFWSSEFKWNENLFNSGFGINYISGNNKNSDNNKNRLFDNLYGARHSFYGIMDYFNDFESSTQSRGLVDLYLSVLYKIAVTTKLQIDFHYFSLQENMLKVNNNFTDLSFMGNYLGSELDIQFNHQFKTNPKLSGGFSLFHPSETMRMSHGKNISNRLPYWIWIQLEFSLLLLGST